LPAYAAGRICAIPTPRTSRRRRSWRWIDDDYSILRKWEERSSLGGFLTVVFRRLLANQRDHELGRWRPDAEATKLGPVGVQIETLLYRDGRTFEEAVPIVRASHPELSRGDLLVIAQRLPQRTDRPRPIPFETAGEIYIPSSERADLVSSATSRSPIRSFCSTCRSRSMATTSATAGRSTSIPAVRLELPVGSQTRVSVPHTASPGSTDTPVCVWDEFHQKCLSVLDYVMPGTDMYMHLSAIQFLTTVRDR